MSQVDDSHTAAAEHALDPVAEQLSADPEVCLDAHELLLALDLTSLARGRQTHQELTESTFSRPASEIRTISPGAPSASASTTTRSPSPRMPRIRECTFGNVERPTVRPRTQCSLSGTWLRS